MRPLCFVLAIAGIAGAAQAPDEDGKMLIAHRGASAYAPEHTLAAYRLAIEQGADYVEQDLQETRDEVLVCLHDPTLERTTNVEEVFPDRGRDAGDGTGKTWPVRDYSLAEIKQLDAGSWFDPKFAGEQVPTFQEAIDLLRGRAGLFPELKAPEVYASRGLDIERLLIETLERNRLARPGADPRTPVIIQSFSAESLQNLRRAGLALPLVLLLGPRDPVDGRHWLTDEGLRQAAGFAAGIGPAKALVRADPTLVRRAHALGLSVMPYTFRSAGQPAGRTVRQELEEFLYTFGVDGVFTDNPDQFPRRRLPKSRASGLPLHPASPR